MTTIKNIISYMALTFVVGGKLMFTNPRILKLQNQVTDLQNEIISIKKDS